MKKLKRFAFLAVTAFYFVAIPHNRCRTGFLREHRRTSCLSLWILRSSALQLRSGWLLWPGVVLGRNIYRRRTFAPRPEVISTGMSIV